MSGLKSRFNDITLIKDTLNIAFDEVNGAINVNAISGTVNADISGQFVKTDISGQFVKTDISGQFVKTDISGQFVNIANFPENIIQGNNTVDNASMNINATDNRLLVNSLVVGNTGNKLVINTDGSINVSGGGGGGGTGGTVTVENNVITSPIVQKKTYDLGLNFDIYDNSQGNNTPPFTADPKGHQGWYYLNDNADKSSNVYFYSNIPGFLDTIQSNITLLNLNYFYAVISLDFIGTSVSNLPFINVGSQVSGLTNQSALANSIYTYTFQNGISLILGEPIVIYFSENTDRKPPDSFMPNLRRIKLQYAGMVGNGAGSNLAYISINTSTLVEQQQEYTLIGAGYKFTQTGGVLNEATCDFLFTAKNTIENNLNRLTFNENNQLLVAADGGGGGGGVVQGINTNTLNAVNISASPDGRLLTNSVITNGANELAINTDGSIIISATNSEDAEFPMTLFAKAHRLFTNTEITSGGNTLAINEDGSINVAGGGGGGGQVQGIDTTSGLAVNINATDNRLLTNSVLVNSTGLTISSTNTGDKECLDVAVISNSSVVRGYDAATSAAVDINATDNRLKTNSLLIGTTGTATEAPLLITAAGNLIVEANAHDGTNNPITSTVVGADRGLNVYIVGGGAGGTGDTLQGTYNNIHTGDLTASTFSTALNINNLYGNESVISYEDTLIGSTNFISIYGSLDNDTNYFYIGVLQPVLVRSTLRQASSVLKLKGLKWIKIYNENTTATLTGVKSTLFSG
jgi:hypothetical protein